LIKQLKPDSPYEFRVLGMDASGATIVASMPLQFRTPTWWQHAGSLRFLAPLLVLLVILGVRRSIKHGAPVPEPREKSESGTKLPAKRPPLMTQGATAKPIEKKAPMMREVEPGRYVIDLGDGD
jgi:hypothetical protein